MTISETYGGATIPVASTTPRGDPTIGKLLAAFKATINAQANAAWTVAGVSPLQDAVVATFAHDPSRVAFALSEQDTPCLFLYRTGSAETPYEQSEDRRISVDTLALAWVYPTRDAATQREQDSFCNAIVKAVDALLRRNRDPAWIDDGDVSTRAQTDGSNLTLRCGFWALSMIDWSRQPVTIESSPGTNGRVYEAVVMRLRIEEALDVSGSREPMGSTGSITVQSAELDGAGDPLVYAELDLPV